MPYVGRMTIQNAPGLVPEWTVGDRLRKARETTGLNRQQFADRLGVTRNTIGSAESGAVAVRRITLNAYAMATGIPAEWLETGETDTPPSVPPGPGIDGPDAAADRQRRLDELAAKKRRRGTGGDTQRYLLAS